jgi:hypothetical protein
VEILNEYCRAIRESIQHYAKFKPAIGSVETEVIFEELNDRYTMEECGFSMTALRMELPPN